MAAIKQLTGRHVRLFLLGAVLSCLFCERERAFGIDGGEAERESFYVAEKAFEDGFYGASETLFKEFIEKYPKSGKVTEAKIFVAKSFYFQKEHTRALEILNSLYYAGGAGEYEDQINYWLAQVNYEGKNYNKAVEHLRKIIEEYPGSSLYWWSKYLLSECYAATGDYENREILLIEVSDRGSDDELVRKAVMDILEFYYSRGKYSLLKKAVDKYYDSFEDPDRNPELNLYKGEALYGTGEIGKAGNVFESALKSAVDKDNTDILHNRIGACFLEENENEKALRQFRLIESPELRSFSEIQYYMKVKDFVSALKTIESFLEEFPKSAYIEKIYLAKADCLYETGRIKDALSVYQYIISIDKEDVLDRIIDKAHYGLAWCYLKAGEFKKAVDEFKNTIQYTDNPVVRISSQIQIADAYQEKGNYETAVETYNEILSGYPDNIYSDYIQFQIGMVFLKKGDLDRAKISFRNLQRDFPSSNLVPQAMYYLSASYFSEKEYAQATDILTSLLNSFPKHELKDKIHYLRGKIFFNEARYKEALGEFNFIMRDSKDFKLKELVSLDIIYSYLNMEEFKEAKESCRKFMAKFPLSEYVSTVLLDLGALYEKEENLKAAVECYDRIINHYPGTASFYDAHFALAFLYWENNELAKAREYLGRLTESGNSRIKNRARFYLADILAQEGNARQSMEIYDDLINIPDPMASLALAKKAFLLKDMKEYSEAAVFFRRALESGVKEPQVCFSLGYCLEKLGRDEEALGEYFKMLYLFDSQEDRVKAYFRIAKIYERGDKISQARKIYNKIISLNAPEAEVAREKVGYLDSLSGSN